MTNPPPLDELLASVIVPVRNGAHVLPELMAALRKQTIPPQRFEVIIGDDGSTDGGTDAIQTGDGRIRVTAGLPLTSDAARNRAAQLARSDMLAFCDADCVPEPHWLEAGLAALHEADMVGGFIRGAAPDRPTIWTFLDMDTFVDQERAVRGGAALTGNLFVSFELFAKVGGFDESLHYFGDYDFTSRCCMAGARLAFSREAVVSHPTYNDASGLLRKVWAVNSSYGWFEGREARRPAAFTLREWIPLVQPLRARRRSGRSLRLDRKRLAENGVRPRPWQDLLALPVQYLVLPYIARVAQLAGWLEGRAVHRSNGLSPTDAPASSGSRN